MKETIVGYGDNFSMLAKHVHEDPAKQQDFFYLLGKKFAEKSESDPTKTNLRAECTGVCNEIYYVFNTGKGMPTNAEDELKIVVDDICNLDRRKLLDVITELKSEYFNTTPTNTSGEEIRARFSDLSGDELEKKVAEVKEKIILGDIVCKKLEKLYATIQSIKNE